MTQLENTVTIDTNFIPLVILKTKFHVQNLKTITLVVALSFAVRLASLLFFKNNWTELVKNKNKTAQQPNKWTSTNAFSYKKKTKKSTRPIWASKLRALILTTEGKLSFSPLAIQKRKTLARKEIENSARKFSPPVFSTEISISDLAG